MTPAELKSKRKDIRTLGASTDRARAVQSIIDLATTDISLAEEAFKALQRINTAEAIIAHQTIVSSYTKGTMPIQHNKPLERCNLACIESLGKFDSSEEKRIYEVLDTIPATEGVLLKKLDLLTRIESEAAVERITTIVDENLSDPKIFASGIMALHKIGADDADRIAAFYAQQSYSINGHAVLQCVVSAYEENTGPYRPKEARKIVTACASQVLGHLEITFNTVAGTDKQRGRLCDLFMRAHNVNLMEDPASAIEMVENYKAFAIK